MKKILMLLCLVVGFTSLKAQTTSAKKEIVVDGLCKNCKHRIEKQCLKVDGVKYADWNIASHILTVVIDENKTNVEKIQKSIARIGHDNGSVETGKRFIAPKIAYDKLPSCCRYRDKETEKNHK